MKLPFPKWFLQNIKHQSHEKFYDPVIIGTVCTAVLSWHYLLDSSNKDFQMFAVKKSAYFSLLYCFPNLFNSTECFSCYGYQCLIIVFWDKHFRRAILSKRSHGAIPLSLNKHLIIRLSTIWEESSPSHSSVRIPCAELDFCPFCLLPFVCAILTLQLCCFPSVFNSNGWCYLVHKTPRPQHLLYGSYHHKIPSFFLI